MSAVTVARLRRRAMSADGGSESGSGACNLSSSVLKSLVVSRARIDYPRAKVGTIGLSACVYNLRIVASFAGVPYPNQLVTGMRSGTNAIEAISILGRIYG